MRLPTRFLLFPLAFAAACIVATPAAAQGSVTLYEHPDFRGTSESFTGDVAALAGSRLGDDRASSVRVAPGCTVSLYEHPDFRGARTVLRGDTTRLAGSEVGDDRVSSLRVLCSSGGPHGVALFADTEYRGREAVFYEDVADLRPDVFPDNAASSVRVPDGCSVTLYEHPDFRGRSETLYEDDPVLANNRIGNDVVSSLRLRCAGSGGTPPPVPGSRVYRCSDRDTGVAFRVDETGRDRGQAALLLGDTEVAAFQVRRDDDVLELRPAGRAGGEVRIDLARRQVLLRERGGVLRHFCDWR
jgi:hypothetical protein